MENTLVKDNNQFIVLEFYQQYQVAQLHVVMQQQHALHLYYAAQVVLEVTGKVLVGKSLSYSGHLGSNTQRMGYLCLQLSVQNILLQTKFPGLDQGPINAVIPLMSVNNSGQVRFNSDSIYAIINEYILGRTESTFTSSFAW